jgi:Flp pilus assembly secretin CpaC
MRLWQTGVLAALLACAGGVSAAQDEDRGPNSPAAAAQAAGNPGGEHEFNLIVGQQKSLSASGVVSYSEGVPGVITVKIPEDQKRIVVSAVRAGSTTLMLIHGDGKAETWYINVYSKDPKSIRHEMRALIGNDANIDVREVGGKIFLDGAVGTQEQLSRIERFAALYQGQVSSLVMVDPTRQKTNVKIDFHFVQFNKTSSYHFGVNWPGNIGQNAVNLVMNYDFILKSLTSASLVVTDSLLPSLDILGTRGWAKVKNVVSVVTTNGGEATFHTGGEVNVKISSTFGTGSLQKIPFGTVVKVHPRYDESTGDIAVSIDAEESELSSVPGQDAPGRVLTNNKTTVHLKLGQSIMLSGFQSDTETKSANGIPGLMRIPIIGYLFRSEQGTATKQQNVLFITPTVITHVSPQSTQPIEDMLRRFDKFGGQVVY